MSHTFISITTQYLFFIVLFLMLYQIIIDNNQTNLNSIKNKLKLGLVIGFSGSLMIFLDMFNDYDSYYLAFSFTIRLLLVCLITYIGGYISSFLTLFIMISSRLLLFGFTKVSITLCITAIIFGLFALVYSKISKRNILFRLIITCIIVTISFSIFFYYINMDIDYIINFILFCVSVIFTSYLLTVLVTKLSAEYNINYEKSNMDQFTNIFNSRFITDKYKDFIIKKEKFIMAVLTIENLKQIKSSISFNAYQELLSELGMIIRSKISDIGIAGKVKPDCYCLLLNTNFDYASFLVNEICVEIDNITKKYLTSKVTLNKIKIKINLINSEKIIDDSLNMTIKNSYD